MKSHWMDHTGRVQLGPNLDHRLASVAQRRAALEQYLGGDNFMVSHDYVFIGQ